jgi:hypothetical protein
MGFFIKKVENTKKQTKKQITLNYIWKIQKKKWTKRPCIFFSFFSLKNVD